MGILDSLPLTTLVTRSGILVDLENPSERDICIEDIAYSLSRTIRFCGHSPGWTVAQHSIVVSQIVGDHCKLEALLHDAAEAYVGDITRPLKNILRPAYSPIEDRFEKVIAERFGLSWPCPAEIKQADLLVCRHEIANFWPNLDSSVDGHCLPLEVWGPEKVDAEFRKLFLEYSAERASIPTRTDTTFADSRTRHSIDSRSIEESVPPLQNCQPLQTEVSSETR